MNIVISGSQGNLGAYVINGFKANQELIVTGYDLDTKNDFLDQLETGVKIDYFIHFGEYSSPEISLEKALENVTNTNTLLRLLTSKSRLKHFIYASSHRVYGSWEPWIRTLQGQSPENALRQLDPKSRAAIFYPITHYANGKIFIENELRRLVYQEHWQCKVAILRIGSILGKDSTSDVDLEVEFNSWPDKMKHSRVLKSDLFKFLNQLISTGFNESFQIIDVIPKESVLNNISSGKNFHNY